MTRGVAAAALGTMLALVAALLWPPCVPYRDGGFGRRPLLTFSLGPPVPSGVTDEPQFQRRDYTTWDRRAWPGELHLRWVGALDADRCPPPRLTAFSGQPANVAMLNALAASGPASVHLPTLLGEVALLLLLGGGLLTWAVRRDRRRRAGAPA